MIQKCCDCASSTFNGAILILIFFLEAFKNILLVRNIQTDYNVLYLCDYLLSIIYYDLLNYNCFITVYSP